MTNLTVGSQFTTAKSGVSGTIQEIVENKTGSFRVRLDVNGQPRWTTVVKQSEQTWGDSVSYPFSIPPPQNVLPLPYNKHTLKESRP